MGLLLMLSVLIQSSLSHAVSGMNDAPTGRMFSGAEQKTLAENPSYEDFVSYYASTPLSTGTTICGLRCVDGVVLGADSRSTSGQLIADPEKQKIRQLAPAIAIAGKKHIHIAPYTQ